MTLQSFKYAPADSLQTAEALLREHGERAAVLAGGTDLLGALKDAIHDDPPELVIGLKPVTALRYVEATPAGVRIGALTTLTEIAKHPAIRETYPLLAEAAASVASPQIRNVATIARQPLPGAALLVLPQPRQHLRLPAQGRPVVRRALRREPLPLDLRRHVRQRRAVRGRLPHPQRHPRVHGRAPGRQSWTKRWRSCCGPTRWRPSWAGRARTIARKNATGSTSTSRCRSATSSAPWATMRWNTPGASTGRPKSKRGNALRSSARGRPG